MSTAESPKRRRWSRFSLRTLLAVITLVCIWLGLYGRQAYRRHVTVAAIRDAGGTIWFDYQSISGESWPNPNAVPAVPAWLRILLGEEFFYHPACVLIDRNSVTDEFISKYAAGLSETHILFIKSTSVTDESLDCIAKMPQLEYYSSTARI